MDNIPTDKEEYNINDEHHYDENDSNKCATCKKIYNSSGVDTHAQLDERTPEFYHNFTPVQKRKREIVTPTSLPKDFLTEGVEIRQRKDYNPNIHGPGQTAAFEMVEEVEDEEEEPKLKKGGKRKTQKKSRKIQKKSKKSKKSKKTRKSKQ